MNQRMGILDIFFPKYCVSCRRIGSYLCSNCFAKLSFSERTICIVCRKFSIDGITHPACQREDTLDGCFVVLSKTSVVKKLLYVFTSSPYVKNVHTVIDELLYEGLIQKEAYMLLLATEKHRLLIPMPLTPKQLRTRGYNQAAILGKSLAQKLRIPFADLLRKNTSGDMLVSVKNTKQILNSTVFIIADMAQKGEAFMAAAKTLKKQGARSVYGIAFVE